MPIVPPNPAALAVAGERHERNTAMTHIYGLINMGVLFKLTP